MYRIAIRELKVNMVGIKDSRTIAILRRLYILELNKNTPPIQTKIMAKIVTGEWFLFIEYMHNIFTPNQDRALVKIKAQFI
tara:strand:- start:7840 stop:8082 length:243 start_codon:yes stop_codon:yes gene_type:complete